MTSAEPLNLGKNFIHAQHNRLVSSNCKGWICPPFAKSPDSYIFPPMSEALDMATIRANLRRLMKKRDVKPTTLSLKVGRNRTLVKDLLEKSEDVQIGTLTKLSGALDVELTELLAAPRVPIVGYIGAGGEIIYEDLGEEDTVLRPPGISGSLIALAVRGSSMLPKYKDGDIIYIQRTHDGVLPEYIGEDCAIRLASGETYIKQLMEGSEPGKFTLLSLNAEPIENVEVQWATLVRFVMPSRSRQLLLS